MVFTDKIKLEVKEKSNFRCCMCYSIYIEIHHIISESEGGKDTFENAAPLCPSCHERWGGNPTKRKFIKQMRDSWYKKCEGSTPQEKDFMKSVNKLLEEIKEQRKNNEKLTKDFKEIKQKQGQLIENLASKGNFNAIPSIAISGSQLAENVYAGFRCSICGTNIGLLVGSSLCPNCGNPINSFY